MWGGIVRISILFALMASYNGRVIKMAFVPVYY